MHYGVCVCVCVCVCVRACVCVCVCVCVCACVPASLPNPPLPRPASSSISCSSSSSNPSYIEKCWKIICNKFYDSPSKIAQLVCIVINVMVYITANKTHPAHHLINSLFKFSLNASVHHCIGKRSSHQVLHGQEVDTLWNMKWHMHVIYWKWHV